MKKIIPAFILTLSVGVAHAEVIVDVTKIAGKSQKEVAAYLGKEMSCGKSKYGKKCQYKKGKTEIVFINGKADWITIEEIDNAPFSKSALNALGIKEKRPSFKNNFTLRWESIQGFRSVSVFKGASKSDYAYIKVKTK
ncbi:MAG: hypothetical protein GY931_08790 [Maribacter sp.]|nr:hypothetical protein [Maribacter sp.]